MGEFAQESCGKAATGARGSLKLYADGFDEQAPSNGSPGPVEQSTLESPVGCRGVGLHSGRDLSIELRPATPDTGIVLRRIDIANGGALIPVTWRNVVDSHLSTTVGNAYGVTVSTIEHLMAAFAGCGIDNAVVELDGPEVPILDGSAAPFVRLVERAGIARQKAPRRAIEVRKRVAVEDGDGAMSLTPAPVLSIDFEIDFDSAGVGPQQREFHADGGTFVSDIARARTFGFAHQVEELRAAGLALGGSLDNAIVIHDGRVLNRGGLRYRDELVRHKILDCVGDLYLAGGPILGRVHATRSGHALNHALLRALFADDDAWRHTGAIAAGLQPG